MIKFTKTEIRDMIIAFIVIAVAFAIANVGFDVHGFISILPIVMVGVGLGFIFRELGHKYVAIKYDCLAEFKMWSLGLIIALATAFIGWVFAAPGEVKFHPEELSDEITGRISLAGPMANMALAILFLVIAALVYPLESYSLFKLIYLICTVGFSVNSFLAAFNLFPVYTLDGLNVFKWNKGIWFIVFILSVTMMLLSIFIGAENMVILLIEAM
ncbi:MAG: site-2 protease family protein [Methanosphaera sp. rholeuAM130]|nr:MAG: site-2 protease family protein [Methanosphaera sp. rholeuAM130]